ncbi:MAG: hypothetical protein ACR2LJ_10755 [Acidimicrobiales bacterium]
MASLTSPAAPWSSTFAADLDVVAFMGVRRSDDPALPRPRFGDDDWDLAAVADIPAYARMSCLTRVQWGDIPHPAWRLCAKEVGLALLQPGIGLEHRLARARRRPLPAHDLARLVMHWRTWFAWLAAHGVDRLTDVTQAHCDAWLAGRLEVISRTSVRTEVIAVRRFADYGPLLSADAYPDGFRPWGQATASLVSGAKHPGENTTPIIPDEVFAPLLAAGLFLVNVAGPDVLAAADHWARLQRPRRLRSSVDDRLRLYLARLRREGRPLPELHQRHLDHQAARGVLAAGDPLQRVNVRLIEYQVGASKGGVAKVPRRRALLGAAVADLGCGGGGLRSPVAVVTNPTDPTDRRPWHGEFSPYELDDLADLVFTGCYVVIAALSGLRYSELAELRRGCMSAERLATGMVRHRIHARVIKGRAFGGEAERWTVIEEVAQAFALVERLVDDDQPFARRNPSARYPRLLRWVNGPGAQAFLTPIPEHWQLNGRQFRRTLARLLGFRPHGVIAGKVHLKHVSVATSEGYYGRTGSSAAAFLAEVEQSRAKAGLEFTKSAYADWEAGRPIAGPGRAELEALFANVRAEVGHDGATLATERRVEELLRRRSATLHVAPLNYCWFVDPGRARCLAQAGRPDATAPLVAMCEPTRCANATIHAEHVPVWLDTRRHIDELVASPRVPDHEKERLAPERERLSRVIDAIGGGDGDGR